MSTRACITIKQKDAVLHMSHHCDGYPDGVGCDLVNILKEYVGTLKNPREWTADGLQEYINGADEAFHPVNFGVRWDQEYVYVIDCDDHTLKGYYKGITNPKEENEYEDYNNPLYISDNIFNYPGEYEEVMKVDKKEEAPFIRSAYVGPMDVKGLMSATILLGLLNGRFSSDDAMIQRAVNLTNKLYSALEK